MLLGKRPRPPIKRTTSMTGITDDITNSNMDSSSSDPSSDHHGGAVNTNPPHATLMPPDQLFLPHLHNMNLATTNNNINAYDQCFLAHMVSPRNPRSSNHGFLETAHFLRTCGLCNRRLAPGRDIYMYRGDTAFCSLECREQKMKQDERKEKLNSGGGVKSKKEESGGSHASRGSSSGATSKASPSKSETVAAA